MKDNSIQDAKTQKIFTIGELCEEFGQTPRTLRFYEQRQLLKPQRYGGRRMYSDRDRERLQLILRTKTWGFTLSEISDILDLCETGDGTLLELWAVLPTLREQLGVLKQQRHGLNSAIGDLERHCEKLTQSIVYIAAD